MQKPRESGSSSLQHDVRRIGSKGDLQKKNNKKCEQPSRITNFTQHFFHLKEPYSRQVQAESPSSSEPRVALQQLLEKWHLDTCCSLDGSTLPRSARERYDREHTTIEKANPPEETELESLLERAKPQLPSEAIRAWEIVEKYLENGENKPSDAEYINSLKGLLRRLSPEMMKEYEEDHGIEFVLSKGPRPSKKNNETSGKWELHIPTKYEYPTKGMILRCFDRILGIEEAEYEKKTAQSSFSRTKIVEDRVPSRQERRAIFAARVFQANMKLGEKGWSIEGYELAEKYYKDYDDFIRDNFKKGLIDTNTPREKLWQMVNEHATRKLLETSVPPEGVPRVFFPLYPGAYFEEFNIKQRSRKSKSGNPDHLYLVAEPIELGSPAFDTLMGEMSRRKEMPRKEMPKRMLRKDTVLNVVITLDKKILVLPCFFREGQQSQHSIVAKGNPVAWAGEVIIKGKKVIKINDQSGHFKTFDYNEEVQKALSDFALQTFRDQGYEVPSEVELTRKRPVAR
jgi:hypothetical protein